MCSVKVPVLLEIPMNEQIQHLHFSFVLWKSYKVIIDATTRRRLHTSPVCSVHMLQPTVEEEMENLQQFFHLFLTQISKLSFLL